MKSRRKFLATGALMAALGFAGLAPMSANAQMVMKAADVHPAGYSTVAAVENMGKKAEAATNPPVNPPPGRLCLPARYTLRV